MVAVAASIFTTTNLAVAAFLVAGKHLRLLDVDVSEPRRAQFVFENYEGRGPGLEAAFLTDGALVPGAEFHRQLRVLRRLIEERSGTPPRNREHSSYGRGERKNIDQKDTNKNDGIPNFS